MLSFFGRIIEECKQGLKSLKDRSESLKFVKRSANEVAHYLARHSCSIADRTWSVDNAHSEFLDVIRHDLMI